MRFSVAYKLKGNKLSKTKPAIFSTVILLYFIAFNFQQQETNPLNE